MRLLLRLALVVGAISGLGLLGLLAWSTGNACASRAITTSC